MLKFKSFKKRIKNKLTNVQTKFKNHSQIFKKKFEEVKRQPRSKRKSLLLGVTTALGIFGVTLLTPILAASAENVPQSTPGPSDACPSTQPSMTPSAEIVKGLTGAAGAICALAVSSGSFLVGIACGVVVAVGILKAQGK